MVDFPSLHSSFDFNKHLTYDHSGLLLKIGVCDLKETVSDGWTMFSYDESRIKQLKREFDTYQVLVEKLIKFSRHNDINVFVPLVALVEYKGVVALAVDSA